MKLTAYDEAGAFAQLQPEWNALLEHSTANMIFSTWDWQSTWWNVYQPGELWLVTCRTEDGRLVGIAPWFIETNAAGERVVRSIGCVDVTDYVDIIADVEHAPQIYDLLAAHLVEHSDRYSRINLCNIPEASPTGQIFRAALERCGFDAELVLQEVCPVIYLPETWDAYLESLDKKQRHEIRRKIRKAEAEADIVHYVVGPEHDLEAELDRFLRLMAASQKQKAEFLSDPANVTFFKHMVPLIYGKGWLQLNMLTLNSQPAAAYLNFDYAGRILVYNSGLLPDASSNLSLGTVLGSYTIKHAIETGHTVFDFLRGNETYKYRMGAEDTRVYKLKAVLRRG